WIVRKIYLRHARPYLQERYGKILVQNDRYVPIWVHFTVDPDDPDHFESEEVCTPPWEEGDEWYAELRSLAIHSLLRDKENEYQYRGYLVPDEDRLRYGEEREAIQAARRARKVKSLPSA